MKNNNYWKQAIKKFSVLQSALLVCMLSAYNAYCTEVCTEVCIEDYIKDKTGYTHLRFFTYGPNSKENKAPNFLATAIEPNTDATLVESDQSAPVDVQSISRTPFITNNATFTRLKNSIPPVELSVISTEKTVEVPEIMDSSEKSLKKLFSENDPNTGLPAPAEIAVARSGPVEKALESLSSPVLKVKPESPVILTEKDKQYPAILNSSTEDLKKLLSENDLKSELSGPAGITTKSYKNELTIQAPLQFGDIMHVLVVRGPFSYNSLVDIKAIIWMTNGSSLRITDSVCIMNPMVWGGDSLPSGYQKSASPVEMLNDASRENLLEEIKPLMAKSTLHLSTPSQLEPLNTFLAFLNAHADIIEFHEDASYTESDNSLFDRAYDTMIVTLDQFKTNTAVKSVLDKNINDPKFKQVFFWNKMYLTAMVAFLSGSYEVVGSDDVIGTSDDIITKTPLAPIVIAYTDPEQTEPVASTVTTPEVIDDSLKSDLALLPESMLQMTNEERAVLSLIGLKEKKELVKMEDVDITNLFNQTTNLTRTNKRQIRHIHCELTFFIKKVKEKIQYDLHAPKRAEAARRSAEADHRFYTHAKLISFEYDNWGNVIGGVLRIAEDIQETKRDPNRSFVSIGDFNPES